MTRSHRLRLAVVATLLCGAAATTVASPAVAIAQRLFADFSGPWNVTVQGPQGPMNSLLTFKQSGDTLSGNFESELGKAAVAGIAKGDSIAFSFELNAGGQMLPITATAGLTPKGALAGSLDVAGMGSFPFVATRAEKP